MFKEKEKGALAFELLTLVAVVIIIGIFTTIGTSIQAQTTVQAGQSLLDVNSVDTNVYDSLIAANRNAAGLVEDTTGYAPILILAIIGGLALMAIMAYMWVLGGTGGAGRMQSTY